MQPPRGLESKIHQRARTLYKDLKYALVGYKLENLEQALEELKAALEDPSLPLFEVGINCEFLA